MKDITTHIKTYYRYNGKFYIVTERKRFMIGDIFIDGRDYGVKIIDDEQDIFDMSFIDPELYVVLEEVTI